MPAVHRHSDVRICGATTTVVGQQNVYMNNLLASVQGDTNTHGGGNLLASVNPGTVFINNLEMVVVGSDASPDRLCPIPPHCNPKSQAGSGDVFAFEPQAPGDNTVSCDNTPTELPGDVTEEPTNVTLGGGTNPGATEDGPQEEGGPFAPINKEDSANAAQAGKDATEKGKTIPGKALDPTLGSLSGKYESNGNAGAIGNDSTGGFSYGEYQIATKTGTFDDYMNYLKVNSPRTYAQLKAAGGVNGAKRGSAGFQNAWQTLMANPEHARTQHDFIQSSHYAPAVRKVQARTGIDASSRSKTLRDVLWSTSVQHGNNTDTIVSRAIERSGKSASTITDQELITAIYDERGKRNSAGKLHYFRSSTSGVQTSVANRFVNEKADALAALSAEGGST